MVWGQIAGTAISQGFDYYQQELAKGRDSDDINKDMLSGTWAYDPGFDETTKDWISGIGMPGVTDLAQGDWENFITAGTYGLYKDGGIMGTLNPLGFGKGKSDKDRRKEHDALSIQLFTQLLGRDPTQDEMTKYSGEIFNKTINSPEDYQKRLLQDYPQIAEQGGGMEGGVEGGHGMGGFQMPNAESRAESEWKNYMRYRPQGAKMEMDLYSQYAPQYAQKQKDIIDKLYPNQSGLGELIAKDVTNRLSKENYEVPDVLKSQYQRSRAEADTSRGLWRSGMSGRAEAEDLAKMGIQMRQSDINTGMQLYGGIPKASAPSSIPGYTPSLADYSNLGLQQAQLGLQQSQMELGAGQWEKQFGLNQETLDWQKDKYETSLAEQKEDEAEAKERAKYDPWITAGTEAFSSWADNKWG